MMRKRTLSEIVVRIRSFLTFDSVDKARVFVLVEDEISQVQGATEDMHHSVWQTNLYGISELPVPDKDEPLWSFRRFDQGQYPIFVIMKYSDED